jgi:hypothetical protein
MDILGLITAARAANREEHIQKEKDKYGVLRAGSTGIMSDENEIAGACHRVSLLRSKGIEVDPPTWDKYIMFELGYANEDVIANQLKKVLPEGWSLKMEEEIPIAWTTSNGTSVTGRPDIVVFDTSGNKVIGLELKSVHSVWVAREVLFKKKPKLANLAQSAHYMWKLGIPEYKLFYKSYSQLGQGMAGSDWIAKQFPRPGEPGSEFVDYTEVSEAQVAKGKGPTIKHIRQFEIVYDLKWDRNGRLQYRVEGNKGVWTNTILTKKSIEGYFEFVSRMEQDKNLGPLPVGVDASGDKLSYSQCKYCPLNQTCKEYSSKGYDKWMEQVLKVTDQNKKTKETVKKSR